MQLNYLDGKGQFTGTIVAVIYFKKANAIKESEYTRLKTNENIDLVRRRIEPATPVTGCQHFGHYAVEEGKSSGPNLNVMPRALEISNIVGLPPQVKDVHTLECIPPRVLQLKLQGYMQRS